jgi:hypothetical protein
MLMAFGITTVDAGQVISPELKYEGNKLYLIKHTPLANHMPDVEQLKANWKFVHEQVQADNIVSGYAIGFGGVAEAICKMSFGNGLDAKINMDEKELFNYGYGSILVEAENALDYPNAILIGEVTDGEDSELTVNGTKFDLFELMDVNGAKFAQVYPDTAEAFHNVLSCLQFLQLCLLAQFLYRLGGGICADVTQHQRVFQFFQQVFIHAAEGGKHGIQVLAGAFLGLPQTFFDSVKKSHNSLLFYGTHIRKSSP